MFHPSPRAPLYLDVVLVLLSQDFDMVKEGALRALEPYETILTIVNALEVNALLHCRAIATEFDRFMSLKYL